MCVDVVVVLGFRFVLNFLMFRILCLLFVFVRLLIDMITVLCFLYCSFLTACVFVL